MKLIEDSSAYVAAASALFVFSALEIGSSLGRFVYLPNSNDNHQMIFYGLLAVLIFAAMSSLGLLLRIRTAYFGAVFSSVILLGYSVFRLITVVAVTSYPRFGVLQTTTAPVLAKSVILLLVVTLLGSKSVRGMLVAARSEQTGTGQPATRPVDEPEGGEKPQPEAEGRSR